MVLTCGIRTMVLGGRTSLGGKPHKCGTAIGMSLGMVMHGQKDRKARGMKRGAGQR